MPGETGAYASWRKLHFGFRVCGLYPPPKNDNQMEQNMENDVETGVHVGVYVIWGYLDSQGDSAGKLIMAITRVIPRFFWAMSYK